MVEWWLCGVWCVFCLIGLGFMVIFFVYRVCFYSGLFGRSVFCV